MEDVTPVVRNGWNEVPFVNYINGVFSMDGFLRLLLRIPKCSKKGGRSSYYSKYDVITT